MCSAQPHRATFRSGSVKTAILEASATVDQTANATSCGSGDRSGTGSGTIDGSVSVSEIFVGNGGNGNSSSFADGHAWGDDRPPRQSLPRWDETASGKCTRGGRPHLLAGTVAFAVAVTAVRLELGPL